MKRNVDLTEHGDFRESNVFELSQWISHLFRDNKRIPWTWGNFKKIESAEDFGDKFELFPTGAVEAIHKKKYYRYLDSGKCCDKCGKPINRYSWFSFSNKTLCDDCDKELQKEYNRDHQLNKIKDYPVTRSSAYWTVYLNTRSGKEDIIMPEDILD